MPRIISLSHDTVNWLSLILKEDNKSRYSYMKNSLERIKDLKIGNNILFRTVLDEIRSILSIKWGMLRKIIETEIQNITLNSDTISISQYSRLIDLLEEEIFEELSEDQKLQYSFIKKNIWMIKNPEVDYLKLNNKAARGQFYADTKIRIMMSIDIENFKNLTKSNIRIYDSFDKTNHIFQTKDSEYLERIEDLLRGSSVRKGSNKQDILHLLSCFFYTEDYTNETLIFCTTDIPMIKNFTIQNFPFLIIDIKNINSYLLHTSNDNAQFK